MLFLWLFPLTDVYEPFSLLQPSHPIHSWLTSFILSIEKAAGPKSFTVVPCEVVEPVTLVSPKIENALSEIET